VIINTLILKETFLDYIELALSDKKGNESTRLISFAYSIPQINILSLVNKLPENYFYWNTPITNEEFLGLLPLYNINEFGQERIENTSNKVNKIQKNFISNWQTLGLTNVPIVMGGIKFAPNQQSEIWNDYSDSDWFIPKIILLKKDEEFFVILNFILNSSNSDLLENEFDETINYLLKFVKLKHNSSKQAIIKKLHSKPVEKWYSIINSALSKISKGELKKTVLSREVKLELDKPPVLSKMLEKLSINYPGCYIFSFRKNNSVFVGASPEKLVKISKKVLEIDALAGSVARGKTDAEDRELEEFLLHSEKNINEQKAVVTFIKDLLTNISAEIKFTEKAAIRKLPNIQHLWTPITAELQNGYMLFDVLKALHPTPAICGTPWDVARDNILELEEHDRGLYSGNIGWFNFNGDGEFAVGIRSALVKGNEVFAYAGCGIVKGSEPQSEFDESEIKLKPILSLFVDEKIYQP
jgi:menaquinone-specific isochorismate synthase